MITQAEYIQQALDLCRGSYQRDIVLGNQAWSGADLRGKASHFACKYYRSRMNLVARLVENNIPVHIEENYRTGKLTLHIGEPQPPHVCVGYYIRHDIPVVSARKRIVFDNNFQIYQCPVTGLVYLSDGAITWLKVGENFYIIHKAIKGIGPTHVGTKAAVVENSYYDNGWRASNGEHSWSVNHYHTTRLTELVTYAGDVCIKPLPKWVEEQLQKKGII